MSLEAVEIAARAARHKLEGVREEFIPGPQQSSHPIKPVEIVNRVRCPEVACRPVGEVDLMLNERCCVRATSAGSTSFADNFRMSTHRRRRGTENVSIGHSSTTCKIAPDQG